MKKIMAVAVAVALILTMIMPSVAFAAVDYSYIRVRLDSMQKKTSIQFKVAGAYRIAESSGVDLYPKITYTLKTYGTGMRLTYNNGKGTVTVTLPAKVTFVQYTNGSGSNFFYLNNTTSGWRNYAGNMTFKHIKTTSSDYIEVVNTVFVETYLYGVVASEMANDWPLEALKAQAVCARTYAMAYIKSRQSSSLNYDVVDTTSNQVYKGYPLTSSGAAQTNVINAVNATRGKVILVGDTSLVNFADGMYSASNGGQIRTITMRYGSGTNTYHVFKDDPYDLNNSNSPKFAFIFPKTTAALNALGTADRSKANTMIDLIKDKVVAALAAQGVTCAKSSITVNAIKGAAPTALKTGMPAGSREYTSVSVTVNVTLAGVTVPAPGVSVTGNGAAIASGSTAPSTANDTDFGGASVVGTTVQKTYTITNTGNAALTVSAVTVTGDNAADFTVGAPSSGAIAAGGAATFTVTFDPSAPGERVTTVSIASDAAASPYLFRIKGTGQSNGNSITAFGFEGYESYLGSISGTAIMVHLPSTVNLTLPLTAKFIADSGATVYVGTAAQTSGETENSFADPLTYTVTAEDGSSRQYTVTVIADVAVPEPAPSKPDAAPESTEIPESGGGGIPTNTTMDITVTLKYISQAADGDWDALGELRTKFASFYSLLNGTNLWLLYASSDSNCYYVTARGYGHGVGLSQRGAQEMAKANKTYLEIIDFYFNMSAGKSTLSTIGLTQKSLPQIPGKGSAASYSKVNTGKLQLRAAASTKGTVLYTLTSGTIVEVLSTSSGWSRVLYGSKGLVGYVTAKYLKKTTQTPAPATTVTATPAPSATVSATATAAPSPTPTPATPLLMGRVTATSLYIRASASTSAAVVYDHLNRGDSVLILDQNAATNWYKVKYASYTGYAMCRASNGTAYIEIIGATPTAAPTATSGSTELTAVTAKANVTDYLTIRASASTSATKLGQIPANASFTVLQVATTANWLKVKYSGTTGYVLAKYATIGGNSGYHACTVTASTLNARSGAGTGNSIVTTLSSGDTLVVTATTTVSSVKWYKVKVGSVTAYVDSRYVRINTTA